MIFDDLPMISTIPISITLPLNYFHADRISSRKRKIDALTLIDHRVANGHIDYSNALNLIKSPSRYCHRFETHASVGCWKHILNRDKTTFITKPTETTIVTTVRNTTHHFKSLIYLSKLWTFFNRVGNQQRFTTGAIDVIFFIART